MSEPTHQTETGDDRHHDELPPGAHEEITVAHKVLRFTSTDAAEKGLDEAYEQGFSLTSMSAAGADGNVLWVLLQAEERKVVMPQSRRNGGTRRLLNG